MSASFVERGAAAASAAEMPLFGLEPEVRCDRTLGGGWVDENGTTRTVTLEHWKIGGRGRLAVIVDLRPTRPIRRRAAWWVAHMGIKRPNAEQRGAELDASISGLMGEEWGQVEVPVDGRPVRFEVVSRRRAGGPWREYWGACCELGADALVSLTGADLDLASVRLTTVTDLAEFVEGTQKLIDGTKGASKP